MSEAQAPAPYPDARSAEPVHTFVQIWAESLSQVLGQIAGSELACAGQREPPSDLSPPGENDLWALVTLSGGLRGDMRFRLTPPSVLGLAQTFMSEPPDPETAPTPDHREAVIELLRQIAGVVSSSAKARWGEVQLRIEVAAAAPSWPPAETFWLQTSPEKLAGAVLEIGLSAALVAELRSAASEASPSAAQGGGSSSTLPPAESGQNMGALNLLMDVQLALSMRFGSRRLLLSEVLDLSPGSVVELDRRVQEPVDLLLDGRLVARGEVVVIDGNYGLRVIDVFPGAQLLPARNS
jgi:flagellar motor switch protein FliN/FliY